MNIILPSSDETGEIRLVFENVSRSYQLPLVLKARHPSGSAFYWDWSRHWEWFPLRFGSGFKRQSFLWSSDCIRDLIKVKT
jgi:hypothetical protein